MTEQTGLVGRHVVDRDGERIGRIAEVINGTRPDDPPLYVRVDLGLLHTQHVLVPAAAAHTDADGDLVVPYTKDAVKGSPRVTTPLELTQELETEVAAYYVSDAIG